MSKYIIKNCDAIHKHPVGHWNCANGIECQKREDCLLKQIVERLESPNNCRYSGKPLIFTDNMLALLDIQEVE